MIARTLKRLTPRGLFGRAALILVVPVVTLQLVVSVVFIQRHFEGVTRQMTQAVVAEAAYLVAEIDRAETAEIALSRLAPLAARLGLRIALPDPAAPPADRRGLFDISGRTVIATLRAGLPALRAVDLLADDDLVLLALETRHGVLGLTAERRRVSASNPHQLLVLMIFTGLLMTGIAYLFLRNQLKPIARLAEVAEAFGKGRVLPYRPRGATEVRAAGAAFLDMRARIERHIEQRTLLLSGVSHDLRTPLTRMKLGLAMLEDGPEVAALRADVAEMERLIDSFLDFARGESQEAPELTDPAALVRGIVERAQRAGQPVVLREIRGEGRALLRPQSVARAVENLIANAVRYGTRAEVRLEIAPRRLTIAVDDDGPGIPAARREEAMRPFTRLDPARNQSDGAGVGLGLSIAADIARGHGGTLRLGASPSLGGLRAELTLAR